VTASYPCHLYLFDSAVHSFIHSFIYSCTESPSSSSRTLSPFTAEATKKNITIEVDLRSIELAASSVQLRDNDLQGGDGLSLSRNFNYAVTHSDGLDEHDEWNDFDDDNASPLSEGSPRSIGDGSSQGSYRILKKKHSFDDTASMNNHLNTIHNRSVKSVNSIHVRQQTCPDGDGNISSRNIEPLLFFADRAKISQVVRVLVSNSLKFTPEGGHISIKGRQMKGSGELDLSV